VPSRSHVRGRPAAARRPDPRVAGHGDARRPCVLRPRSRLRRASARALWSLDHLVPLGRRARPVALRLGVGARLFDGALRRAPIGGLKWCRARPLARGARRRSASGQDIKRVKGGRLGGQASRIRACARSGAAAMPNLIYWRFFPSRHADGAKRSRRWRQGSEI